MVNYLVTPKHKNGYKAPGILVNALNKENAPETAKKLSRLSDSNNWNFNDIKELYPTSLSGKSL